MTMLGQFLRARPRLETTTTTTAADLSTAKTKKIAALNAVCLLFFVVVAAGTFVIVVEWRNTRASVVAILIEIVISCARETYAESVKVCGQSSPLS